MMVTEEGGTTGGGGGRGGNTWTVENPTYRTYSPYSITEHILQRNSISTRPHNVYNVLLQSPDPFIRSDSRRVCNTNNNRLLKIFGVEFKDSNYKGKGF